MSKHGKEKEGMDEGDLALSPDVYPERTREFRERIDASLSVLQTELFADEKNGRMIEPTLQAIHLRETILRAQNLCDEYRQSRGTRGADQTC